MKQVKRTKGNAKHLFETDIHDGWLRKIPEAGDFGYRNIPDLGISGLHIGTDYGANIGEKVIAYDDYEVLSTSGHSDYGKQVFLYFPKINKTGHYAHLDTINVKPGQKGKARDVIGTSGNTGKSQGPHLHFSFGSGKITNTSKSNPWEDFEKYVYKANDSKPSFDEVVQGVIDGKYGNGQARVDAVNATGHNYDDVQKRVNERLAGAKPKPKPKPQGFNPYNYLLPKGSKLYDSKGNAHAYPTTKEHTVKILQEKNGLGLIKEQWLVGVNEAWVKLGSKPKPKPTPQPKPSLVGKQVKLSGNTRLFHKATGSTTYPYNSVNKYTNLRTRHVPVVEETGDRVRVKITGFDPELIWVDKKELR